MRAAAAWRNPSKAHPQNGMSNSFAKISPDGKWIVFVTGPERAVDEARRKALHRPRRRREGAPDELQYAADELVAQLFAERALAGLLFQEPLSLHATVPHSHRRERQ